MNNCAIRRDLHLARFSSHTVFYLKFNYLLDLFQASHLKNAFSNQYNLVIDVNFTYAIYEPPYECINHYMSAWIIIFHND